jgi:glycosyltransferase involved in cell wall biosynthesis
MRIVFLSPVGAIGGAERVLLDVIASLHAAIPAADIHLITGSDGPLIQAARAASATVTLLPMPPAVGDMGDYALVNGRKSAKWSFLVQTPKAAWSAWRYANKLRKLLANLQPTVIHSNGIKFHLLTRIARLNHAVIVWHMHDFLGSRPLMARALRWAGQRAAGAIAISQAVAKDAKRILPFVPVEVVPNAVDTAYFSPGPGDGARLDQLAKLPPVESAVVRIGLVATFALWKGHEVFLEAAQRIAEQRLESAVRFFIVGGPIYQTRGSQWAEDDLRKRGADLAAAGKLGFLGFQQDINQVYRSLDIVVHASTRPEPFGLTIVEAMACGRATVVTESGGASELFSPGHDAIGVPPGNADALARAIADLVSDPAQRHMLGMHARATAVERFCRERLGPQILRAYRKFGAVI